jgi:DNA polymerase delta subunit 1
MDIFPVDWSTHEDETIFEVIFYGKTQESESVCVRVKFLPYFYVEIPSTWNVYKRKNFLTTCVDSGANRDQSTFMSKQNIYGFTNGSTITVLRLAFDTMQKFKYMKRQLENKRMQLYETSCDQIIRLMHVRNILPCKWIHIERFSTPEQRISRCQKEVKVHFQWVTPSTVTSIPPLIIASFDIECYSASGGFPIAENEGDTINVICTCFEKFGEKEPYLKHAVVMGKSDTIDGVEVVEKMTEEDVIQEWIQTLQNEDIDILVAWNSYGFDYKYIYNRCQVLVDNDTGLSFVDLSQLGKAQKGGGLPISKQLNTNAYGENNYFFISAPGILHLDLMQIVRKEKKLDRYTLNHVSDTYLGDTKIDLPPQQIFAKCVSGDPHDLAEVTAYCIKDTELPLRLMHRLCTLHNMLEMANATSVPFDFLITRGLQIRVYSLILKKARSLDFICPEIKTTYEGDGYKGATVLEPERGSYLKPYEIVCALDFASLYPSIMRAENMCLSSLVLDDEMYGQCEGIEYYTIETPIGIFKFAQNTVSVLPSLLDDLAQFRKQSKKLMAEAKEQGDTEMEKVHNSSQLAYKICMNSVYGALGVTRGYLPCIPIAVSVTSTGRNMISQTRDLVHTLNPGSRVIYGDTDSVLAILNPPHIESMESHFEVAEKLADQISQTFKKPHCLEFEKAYHPYLLFSKKRYAGMLYTNPHTPDYMDAKGLQLIRRDSCPFVREMSHAILDSIMQDRQVDLAISKAKEYVLKLLRHEVPFDAFIVSKTLKNTYKNPDSQPHLQVALKIAERRGYPVPSNERVPFVIIQDPSNVDLLIAHRAEDPNYATEHGLKLDTLHYFDSQVTGPLESLMEILESGAMQKYILDDEDIQPLLHDLRNQRHVDTKEAKRVRKNVMNRQREISSYFFTKPR